MGTMYCVICRSTARYNRAIVDNETGESYGGLCSDCERRIFRQLTDGPIDDAECCSYCDQRAIVALPEHHIQLQTFADIEVESEGYPLTVDTPRLCELHSDRYLGEDLREAEPDLAVPHHE